MSIVRGPGRLHVLKVSEVLDVHRYRLSGPICLQVNSEVMDVYRYRLRRLGCLQVQKDSEVLDVYRYRLRGPGCLQVLKYSELFFSCQHTVHIQAQRSWMSTGTTRRRDPGSLQVQTQRFRVVLDAYGCRLRGSGCLQVDTQQSWMSADMLCIYSTYSYIITHG